MRNGKLALAISTAVVRALAATVLDLRRLWQGAMRGDCSRKIEELTGRTVIGVMGDNHIDPDVAVEVFILQPLGEDPAVQAARAVADPAPD